MYGVLKSFAEKIRKAQEYRLSQVSHRTLRGDPPPTVLHLVHTIGRDEMAFYSSGVSRFRAVGKVSG